jgi:hypothetical protein
VEHLEGEGILDVNELILSFDRRYMQIPSTPKNFNLKLAHPFTKNIPSYSPSRDK